jgi:hypothetical protein
MAALSREFLFDVYEPWDQLLVKANELKGAPLKRYLASFIESIPTRVSAWEMVAHEAGMRTRSKPVPPVARGFVWPGIGLCILLSTGEPGTS